MKKLALLLADQRLTNSCPSMTPAFDTTCFAGSVALLLVSKGIAKITC